MSGSKLSFGHISFISFESPLLCLASLWASPKRSRSPTTWNYEFMVEINSQATQNIAATQVLLQPPLLCCNPFILAISIEFTSSYQQAHPSFNIPTFDLTISKWNLCSANNLARTLWLWGQCQHWQVLCQTLHQLLFTGWRAWQDSPQWQNLKDYTSSNNWSWVLEATIDIHSCKSNGLLGHHKLPTYRLCASQW
jgi:hypothetical protein